MYRCRTCTEAKTARAVLAAMARELATAFKGELEIGIHPAIRDLEIQAEAIIAALGAQNERAHRRGEH